MAVCNVCPRECSVDRSIARGFCGVGDEMTVAKIMLHHWEEPCISGAENSVGSSAIFFSGCSLKCVYCQNRDISRQGVGREYSVSELADVILRLQSEGAHNINFVTPTHFTFKIIEAVDAVKDRLFIPTVWNTSGYEKTETLRLLEPYIDIFLTDFKYCSAEKASRYSSAPDYGRVAKEALCEMVRITGKPSFENGMLKKGTVVRHLVLPGAYRDSIEVLKTVDEAVGHENVVLSLMAQYTPEFLNDGYGEIDRRVTTFEYEKAVSFALSLGFDGYIQSRGSATSAYTPDFGDSL